MSMQHRGPRGSNRHNTTRYVLIPFVTCLVLAAFSPAALALTILSGQDCLTTPCGGGTTITFGSGDIPPLPADFFGPGSDPFTGSVSFGGPGGFPGDTLVNRLADADLTSGSAIIPIEIVQLDLVSCDPITVSFNGGTSFEQWDLQIRLDSTLPSQPVGQMTIHHTQPGFGGTFDSVLPVVPEFQGTEFGNPTHQTSVLQPGITSTLEANDVPWTEQDLPGVTCTSGFSPTACLAPDGVNLCCVISCHVNPADPAGHPHCILMPDCEPCPPDLTGVTCAPPPPPPPVPAMSEWGAAVMLLLFAIAGTIVFTKYRTIATR